MRSLGIATLASLAFAGSAQAAFPGQNGRIAYENGPTYAGGTPNSAEIYSVSPDGTGPLQLTSNAVFDGGPALSPDGSRIAFASNRDGGYEIYTMPASGGAATRLTNNSSPDFQPAWSPGGSKIAFTSSRGGIACGGPFGGNVPASEIYVMNADGASQTALTLQGSVSESPAWSPDGTRIAWQSTDWFYDFDEEACLPEPAEIWVSDPDGTDRQFVARDNQRSFISMMDPAWSPDGKRIVFSSLDPEGIGFVNANGTGQTVVNTAVDSEGGPAWSPDGTRIAFHSPGGDLFTMNTDGSGVVNITNTPTAEEYAPDWQPLPVTTTNPHVRPKGATPVRVPLVPAYRSCNSSHYNRQHGPPLAFPSCSPPVPESSRLTIGVGDGSPAFARGSGGVRMDVVVGAPGPPDDSDVNIRFTLTNVMRASDLSEYTGELRTELTVRRTDRDPPEFGAPQSTSMDFPFGFTVPCTPTPGSSLDASTCTSFTSANALVPLAIEDTHRAIWALDKVRVYDGGPDEDGDTDAGRSLFMTQGVFVP